MYIYTSKYHLIMVAKNARDIGIAWKCHLSNIVHDSTFYDSMGWRISRCFFVFFFKGDNYCFPKYRRDGLSIIVITLMGVGKP